MARNSGAAMLSIEGLEAHLDRIAVEWEEGGVLRREVGPERALLILHRERAVEGAADDAVADARRLPTAAG
jgi:hypothetical protein